MQSYKTAFIDFMLDAGVLSFGDFTTKSGRRTPYFINTGRYRTGAQLARLAGYYADAIAAGVGRSFDVLFGPAYKGIPLATATAMELSGRGHEEGICFNRKEAKDHGEGGSLVGCVPRDGDRVLIIEDVTTAGTSVRETVPLLRSVADVKLAGLVVSVDRMERGQGELSALDELQRELSMPTFAIVTLDDIITHLESTERGKALATGDLLARIAAYRATYDAQQA